MFYCVLKAISLFSSKSVLVLSFHKTNATLFKKIAIVNTYVFKFDLSIQIHYGSNIFVSVLCKYGESVLEM